jgi:hypothetical protein
VINQVTQGRAHGITEPVIRERARRGDLDAIGVRCLRLGAQWRVPTADVLRLLGISPDMQTAGSAPTEPARQIARPARETTDADSN